MGRKSRRSQQKSNTLAIEVDQEGKIRYDAIAKQGHGSNRIVQTSYSDLIPLRQRANAGDISLQRPSAEEVAATTEKTKEALAKIIDSKIESSNLGGLGKKPSQPTYIRYTPSNMMGESSDVKHRQRIIKMVDVVQDPLAPPKFKHTKVPRGPPSPPPPILRSPPRKLTAKDQEAWYIPPSVSNWKNPKGFTIALDKRVAADGRGLQDVEINDNFAKLSEALYAADRSAREELRQRSLMQKKLAEKENALKEERLRDIAQQARLEREAPHSKDATASRSASPADSDNESESSQVRRLSESESESETVEEKARRIRREERKREAEKDLRLSRMGAEKRIKTMARDQDRDISEKVALGLARPTKVTGEAQMDSRLFSQVSTGGLSSAFNEDQVYDRSLFAAREAVQSIYRPRGGNKSSGFDEDDGQEELDRFGSENRFESLGKASKGFKGAEAAEPREGPVEFERDSDPFGVSQMMSDVKEGKKYGLN